MIIVAVTAVIALTLAAPCLYLDWRNDQERNRLAATNAAFEEITRHFHDNHKGAS